MADPPLLHDRYRIERRLGRGAFGTVYLAYDLRMERPVAIKVVDSAADRRALREAQAAAKLDHAHIVTIHEVVHEHERTLLFTEYVEGSTLRELYTRGRLTDAEVVEAGIQMCRALEHAHRRGVIHRDLKPENIMMVEGEGVDVRIMDFGVARMEDLASITLDGELVGTLAYMAPEQLAGNPVDGKADVYSVALTLYEGLTGTNPLKGKDVSELLRGPSQMVISRLSRFRSDLPEELDEAFRKALDRDPGRRVTPAAFRRLLEKGRRKLPDPEPTIALWERTAGLVPEGEQLDRLAFVGRHVVSGLLAVLATAFVLGQVSFYPSEAVVPAVAFAGFAALLSPTAGGILALTLMAPPVISFSPGWGILYGVSAVALFAALRMAGREWAALLPGAVPVALGAGIGLALPAVFGALLRWWGPVAGIAAGAVIALAAGFQGWEQLPFVHTAGLGPYLLQTRHVEWPGEAALLFARYLDLRPELLLTAGVFAAFSIPFRPACRGPVERRLWVAAAYLSALFAVLVLAPPLLIGVTPELLPLLGAFVPCVIIVVLLALLTPATASEPVREG